MLKNKIFDIGTKFSEKYSIIGISNQKYILQFKTSIKSKNNKDKKMVKIYF